MRAVLQNLALLLLACLGFAALASAGKAPARGGNIAAASLSALQYIGTHNSYHVEPDETVKQVMLDSDYAESTDWPARKLVPALSFTHPPIQAQLDMGLRLFEFDMHDDPAGGRFARPGLLTALSQRGQAAVLDADTAALLAQPGIKVFHTADTDIKSRCLLLARCLTIIRDWSRAHPGHVPIIIQLETKEARKRPLLGAYQPAEAAPFTDAAWERLHGEIFGVFKPAEVVLPLEVQGTHASLNDAVRAGGWPDLDQVRGRVIFMLLDADDKQRDYIAFTRRSAKPLVLFPSINHRNPDTAWLIRPNPKAKDIRQRVSEGFLVYTRADKHTDAARVGDYTQRDRALLSGAQLISTDFPVRDPRYSNYAVTISGRYIGCNGVYQKEVCASVVATGER